MGVAVSQGTVGVSGNVTINAIQTNNRPIHVGSVNSIGQNTLTTVTTMPSNGIKYITKILCSGEVNGRWEIYVNSVLKSVQRTTDRNVAFDFNLPMKVLATEVVDIKVIHFGPEPTSDFDATIFGYSP